MKPRRPDAFHFPPVHEFPCPAFHPLDDAELLQLRAAWPAADHYGRMSIMRRVEQGIEGMTTPNPTAGPTFEAARRAVGNFVAWVDGDESMHVQLQILLGITQPELLAA